MAWEGGGKRAILTRRRAVSVGAFFFEKNDRLRFRFILYHHTRLKHHRKLLGARFIIIIIIFIIILNV